MEWYMRGVNVCQHVSKTEMQENDWQNRPRAKKQRLRELGWRAIEETYVPSERF